MGRVAVYYDKYPELADKCRHFADPDSTDAYALMPKSRWLAIRDGKPILPPPEPIPAEFTVEKERRRTRQGGCCGQPTE